MIRFSLWKTDTFYFISCLSWLNMESPPLLSQVWRTGQTQLHGPVEVAPPRYYEVLHISICRQQDGCRLTHSIDSTALRSAEPTFSSSLQSWSRNEKGHQSSTSARWKNLFVFLKHTDAFPIFYCWGKTIVSVLAALHWLPVNVRIQLKVFKALKVWLQRVDLSCCSRLLQDEVVDDPLMLPKPDSHPGQSSFLMG